MPFHAQSSAPVNREFDVLGGVEVEAGGSPDGLLGRKPPAGLSKDLLGRMIAWHIQEQAFGGLRSDRGIRASARPGTRGETTSS